MIQLFIFNYSELGKFIWMWGVSKRQYCTRKNLSEKKQFFRTDKLTDIEKSKGEYQEPNKTKLG